LEKLAQEEFDAVVFDVRLPDGNAIEAIPGVRAKNPAIKIFVISGMSDSATAQAALAGGADEFLIKPIAVSDLCVSITNALG
jgi:two-component system NtrC family response regulator